MIKVKLQLLSKPASIKQRKTGKKEEERKLKNSKRNKLKRKRKLNVKKQGTVHSEVKGNYALSMFHLQDVIRPFQGTYFSQKRT